MREGADLSITQRRTEPRVLLDRLAAIQEVSDYLPQHGLRREKRWYDRAWWPTTSATTSTCSTRPTTSTGELFLDSVNAFLDGVSPWAFRRLPATERLKWHLVRRRMLPELLEILRFQREDAARDRAGEGPRPLVPRPSLSHRPPAEAASLAVPGRPRAALLHRARRARLAGRQLRIEGWAFLDGIGAPDRRSQRITLTALPRGRLRALRLRAGGVRVRATPVHRPDLVAASGTELADVSWAGFRHAGCAPAGRQG